MGLAPGVSDAASAGAATRPNLDDIEKRPLSEASVDAQDPKMPGRTSIRNVIWNVASNLLLVLALVGASLAAWKKVRSGLPSSPAQANESIKVGSTVALAPQRYLHLVTIGDRRLLVGSSAQQVTLIADLAAPAGSLVSEPAGAASRAEDEDDRFKHLLARLESHGLERLGGVTDRRDGTVSRGLHTTGRAPSDDSDLAFALASSVSDGTPNAAWRSPAGDMRRSRLFGNRVASNGAGRHE
jgi:flagellar biogenesis protein FliO